MRIWRHVWMVLVWIGALFVILPALISADRTKFGVPMAIALLLCLVWATVIIVASKDDLARAKWARVFPFMALILAVGLSGCFRVEPGYVGVKVELSGGEKGVVPETGGVGYHWNGPFIR